MSMDYYYDPLTIFNLKRMDFRPSILPKLRIQFHFFFEIEYNNYYLNHDVTIQGFIDTFPTAEAYASATVAVDGESLSFAAVGAAVGRAVRCRVPAVGCGREDLIEFAFEQAREWFPADQTLPSSGVLHLTFAVGVEHRYVYVVESERPFAIPAAEEPSSAFLEKDEDEERCCCICLEELGSGGGGGAAKMPCSHVFHGGCIDKWLRKSPCCPLCRYEM